MADPWIPQEPPPGFAERVERAYIEQRAADDRAWASARHNRLIAVLTVLTVLAGCGDVACGRSSSSQDPQVARAVAAVALVGEDLAAHRPPAGFCDDAIWRDFLPEPWANAEMRLSPFRIEGQPSVTVDKTIQVDFVASMATADRGRARAGMRALLRKSEPPCVLIFTVRREGAGGDQ